ncbi:uncharacterized protein LOC141705369 [Apium graveolens]|uniref:uncharacterized protein LOC141705366 n=1 Tax=Apium graveolens TaxID=4045 RepID=UPI003D797725
MGESTTLECMKIFCQQVEGLSGEEYLRAPTPADLRRLLTRGKKGDFQRQSLPMTVWHAFFGVPVAQNDINVLGQSPVFDKVIGGDSPTVVFHVNGKRYNNAYYLADGIYPRYSTFVKTISNSATQSQNLFAKKQKAYRKDVENFFFSHTLFSFLFLLVWTPLLPSVEHDKKDFPFLD